MIFEARDYSQCFDVQAWSTMYGAHSTASSTVMLASGNATGSFIIRKELPVSVHRASIVTCSSTGDPHFTTYDRMYYNFHTPGSLQCAVD